MWTKFGIPAPGPPALHQSMLDLLVNRRPCCAPSRVRRSPEEFSQHIEHALAHEPHPMTLEERRHLTWEAATERFLDVTGGWGVRLRQRRLQWSLAQCCAWDGRAAHLAPTRRLAPFCPHLPSPAELTEKDLKHSAVDNILWGAHKALTGSEPLRALAGAGANTRDAPQRLTDYDPSLSEAPGLFDDRKRLTKAADRSGGAAGGGGRAAARAAVPVAAVTVKQRV